MGSRSPNEGGARADEVERLGLALIPVGLPMHELCAQEDRVDALNENGVILHILFEETRADRGRVRSGFLNERGACAHRKRAPMVVVDHIPEETAERTQLVTREVPAGEVVSQRFALVVLLESRMRAQPLA